MGFKETCQVLLYNGFMTETKQLLQQAFAFTLQELEANRTAQLSPAQVARLEKYRQQRGCGRRMAAIAFGLTALAMAAAAFLLDAPGIEQARPYLLFVAGIVAVIFILSLVGDYLAGRDLAQSRITVAEGQVQTWSKEVKSPSSHLGTAYYFKIGRNKYQLESAQQMQALQNGRSYRFFFVKNGRVPIILSVEPLEAA